MRSYGEKTLSEAYRKAGVQKGRAWERRSHSFPPTSTPDGTRTPKIWSGGHYYRSPPNCYLLCTKLYICAHVVQCYKCLFTRVSHYSETNTVKLGGSQVPELNIRTHILRFLFSDLQLCNGSTPLSRTMLVSNMGRRSWGDGSRHLENTQKR